MSIKRQYPVGAEFTKKGTHFRVWAADHAKVSLILENQIGIQESHSLKKEDNGYFSTYVPELQVNTNYYFKLGNQEKLFPDPASRYQPYGFEGPSRVIDTSFSWTDEDWPGIDIKNQILYEMHIGTFTQEGTFNAAKEQLKELANIGITTIEIMPINEFPGRFGWGYDGVFLFAPYHNYGTPDDAKSFINHAHKLGLGVILDVVYNHFGPEGSNFAQFSKDYYHPDRITEWGDAINFDKPSSREYFTSNARYWIEEFHFDGLRIDATPWFYCKTPEHILEELVRVVKKANPKKKKIVIGECETQDIKLLQSKKQGGYEFDALWNDDFHHTAWVRLRGKREAYYTDYLGTPQEFISGLKYGFLYQGQYYSWQKKNRGKQDLTLPYHSMVIFLENHDQVANTIDGKRLYQLYDFGNFKAFSCLMLLSPNTPMLFQGQEFGSIAPFHYFADHNEKLNELVFKGRKEFLTQFPSLNTKEAQSKIIKPHDLTTFTKCKLNFSEREKNKEHYALYKDLIRLRKEDDVFKDMELLEIDGAVLTNDAFLIRYFGAEKGDRLVIINFGNDLILNSIPEPLIAPGENTQWNLIWSSESPKYKGGGTAPTHNPIWKVPAHCALVLKSTSNI